MAKNSRPSRLSRFSPAYLLRRHAGTVFLFLALGLSAGMAQRVLVQPVRYSAAADAQLRVVPEESAGGFDWQAKQRDWDGLLSDRQELGLLGSNFRHALKLAVTASGIDAGDFSGVFSRFGAAESYSALAFRNPYLARLGPAVSVSREELAENLDFQSLAAIIADLEPAPGAEGWDFAFYDDFRPASAADDALVAVDALPGVVTENPAFRVLFVLHRALRGAEAGSLADAWKTATGELAARLAREAEFAGGGGFGEQAKRELLREIAALPALAANNMHSAESWYRGESELPAARWADAAVIELAGGSANRPGAGGTVRVSFASSLNPVLFPRDTVLTRTQPLAVSTLLATLAARESRQAVRAAAPVAVVAPAAPVAVPAPVVAVPAPEPAPQPVVACREEIDDAANADRLARIDTLEEALRPAARDRDACLRRLTAAREDETRLSVEAMNARQRADRLHERYDSAAVLAEGARAPEISRETKKLLLLRDNISRRLHGLLTYCTEDHPFVIMARRELAAVEASLGGHVNATPGPDADEAAAALAARLAGIYVELETAVATAGDLEERRSRQAEAVASLAEELNNIEAAIARDEAALDAARREPVPMRRIEIAPEPAPEPTEIPEPVIAPEAAAPVPAPAPPPAALPAPAPEKEEARLAFSAPPASVPLQASARDWSIPLALAVSGFALGILISIIRELLASRFANPAEARRMAGLPVLATLPAYDEKSFRRAAATVKGEVTGKRAGALQFIPAPVELFEPPTEARRGRVLRVKRRPRVLAWVCGLVLILAAAFLYYLSPGAGSPPPAAAVPVWRSTP